MAKPMSTFAEGFLKRKDVFVHRHKQHVFRVDEENLAWSLYDMCPSLQDFIPGIKLSPMSGHSYQNNGRAIVEVIVEKLPSSSWFWGSQGYRIRVDGFTYAMHDSTQE